MSRQMAGWLCGPSAEGTTCVLEATGHDGRCVRTPFAGEPCDPNGPRCEGLLDCVNSVCAIPATGTACPYPG